MPLSQSPLTEMLLHSLSHSSVSRPQPVEKAVPSDWHLPTAGFSLQCTALISNSQTNSPFISTLFVKAVEGTLHSHFYHNNIQWAPKLMFKHPNNTSQRSALSLKFNFGVNLFQESRIVSLAKTKIEKKTNKKVSFVCLLAVVQMPKLSTKTKDGQSSLRTLS